MIYLELEMGSRFWEKDEMRKGLFEWEVLIDERRNDRYRHCYMRRGEVGGGLRMGYEILLGHDGYLEEIWVEDKLIRMLCDGGRVYWLRVRSVEDGGPMEEIC